jgi:hypothetical protein
MDRRDDHRGRAGGHRTHRAPTAVAANLAAIIGGILVFDEPIGSGALATAARFLAVGLVIAGGILMPGPVRTTAKTA